MTSYPEGTGSCLSAVRPSGTYQVTEFYFKPVIFTKDKKENLLLNFLDGLLVSGLHKCKFTQTLQVFY